jgi:hypothetical protein
MKTLIFTSSAFQYSCFISGNDIEHSLSESAKLAEKKRKEQVEKNRKVISTFRVQQFALQLRPWVDEIIQRNPVRLG